MEIIGITFSATKTRQEKQFEPFKVEVAMSANVMPGEKVEEAFALLRHKVYIELDRSFAARELWLRQKASKLDELKRKRDNINAAIARGEPYDDDFYEGVDFKEGGAM